MFALSTIQMLMLAPISILLALGVLWVIGRISEPRKSVLPARLNDSDFLFDEDVLMDQNLPVETAERPIFDSFEVWDDLRRLLARQIDDLPVSLLDLNDAMTYEFAGGTPEAPVALHIRRSHHTARVTLCPTLARTVLEHHIAHAERLPDPAALSALQKAPDPIWQTDANGTLIWQNEASRILQNADGALPDMSEATHSFDDIQNPVIQTTDLLTWFEIHSERAGNDNLHFAKNITKVIEAKNMQREFVQTLTKTFANLTIGLAIFDRKRRLALFNPALVDLTKMPVPFLSMQPDLMAFFDQLRERQVLPEPKNYADWRSQIRDVVDQANSGLYQELWTLPSGLTFRVTGRPYPDGAVAFLFEDISAEISLTRRFRSQVELRQSVLDALDDGIAIIAPNHVLMLTNKACNTLLQIDPDNSFADLSLSDLMRICEDKLGKSDVWQDIEQTLRSDRIRRTPEFSLPLRDGNTLTCQVKPLSGGMRKLIFSTPKVATERLEIKAAS